MSALAMIEQLETEQEKAALAARAAVYWESYHPEATDRFRDELIARVGAADLDNPRFPQIDAAVLEQLGIAAKLYPDLFAPGERLVDKDGLADCRDLLRRMKQLQPGVFTMQAVTSPYAADPDYR